MMVAVSSGGNHDNRNYAADWGEKWQGLLKILNDKRSDDNNLKKTNYDNQANQLLVKNLKGKLLLAHGNMDNNVPPYSTLLVVDELIKANKDFDLIIFLIKDMDLEIKTIISQEENGIILWNIY